MFKYYMKLTHIKAHTCPMGFGAQCFPLPIYPPVPTLPQVQRQVPLQLGGCPPRLRPLHHLVHRDLLPQAREAKTGRGFRVF